VKFNFKMIRMTLGEALKPFDPLLKETPDARRTDRTRTTTARCSRRHARREGSAGSKLPRVA
jgi:hypothetical protein